MLKKYLSITTTFVKHSPYIYTR